MANGCIILGRSVKQFLKKLKTLTLSIIFANIRKKLSFYEMSL
ncbi:hypothetical protein M23134_00052 [Microscilla marina ATCC 23134]|uniref:Uncharacterized protein n=1 Tax=Microscilla marina ATCC 23134 TaxID=313606 RepID=A1ZKT2_MICM2|nr:hypothetical protein M23134_00052 [Microscilla marina ATCC 23134]